MLGINEKEKYDLIDLKTRISDSTTCSASD